MSEALLIVTSLLIVSLGLIQTIVLGSLLSDTISEKAHQNGRYALIGQSLAAIKTGRTAWIGTPASALEVRLA